MSETENNSESSDNLARPSLAARMSAAGGRPSLVSGLHPPTLTGRRGKNFDLRFEDSTHVPARPRRLWKIRDATLPARPPFYPPPPRGSGVYVADAAPSVVAVRISEGLRRLRVAVEYDEETVTAHCTTMDRCHFAVHMWQGRSTHHNNQSAATSSTTSLEPMTNNDATTTVIKADLVRQGVLVEFRRICGNVMTYHRVAKCLRAAALSHGTGEDLMRTKPHQFCPREDGRIHLSDRKQRSEEGRQSAPDSDIIRDPISLQEGQTLAVEGVENALGLLRKDRLDAQRLGMESLVNLTDLTATSPEVAKVVSWGVLGASSQAVAASSDAAATLDELHKEYIWNLLVLRETPEERRRREAEKAAAAADSKPSTGPLACTTGFLGKGGGSTVDDPTEDEELEQIRADKAKIGDEWHGGYLRSMALRVFTNALQVLAHRAPTQLTSILMAGTPSGRYHPLVSDDMIRALASDLSGANRPPSILRGTRLASPHESWLALRCLRLLGIHCPSLADRLRNKAFVDLLDKAYYLGQAHHQGLEQESKKIFQFLTEDDRSF